MGSDKGMPDAKPSHKVVLDGFRISRHEVTQKEYLEVMGENPSCNKNGMNPVENVSWFDAVEYCNARSVREGFSPLYAVRNGNVTWDKKATGYRLPTEAEWEYAYYGGKRHDKFRYAGSDVPGQVAVWDDNSGLESSPVGSKKPNSLGLYDMAGSVSEWCWDWFAFYPAGKQKNPVGPVSGDLKTARGGSWHSLAEMCEGNYRQYEKPEYSIDHFGFRLVFQN
ncbi:MAG: SUMF1/EgtB/PvdO family nonheme iron enzyme [Spirochaetales bacterium]|nr:SUMF1/EgtB/PvdO family nonheme iron enzyme [Spirochaetales bacterium]